jgi:hypothetical protein
MTHLQSGTPIPIRHWVELIDTLTADAPPAPPRADAPLEREGSVAG